MFKPTAHLENQMILPDDFFLPFGGKLDKENRWVQLAALVPWTHAEKQYGQHFKKSFRGQHMISLRKGLGALIIQERMQLTDRETVESISENPYMQYFIGLAGFEMKPPFHHSMMTHFRKRLVHVLAELNEIIAIEGAKASRDEDDHDDHDDNDATGSKKILTKRTNLFHPIPPNNKLCLRMRMFSLLNPRCLRRKRPSLLRRRKFHHSIQILPRNRSRLRRKWKRQRFPMRGRC